MIFSSEYPYDVSRWVTMKVLNALRNNPLAFGLSLPACVDDVYAEAERAFKQWLDNHEDEHIYPYKADDVDIEVPVVVNEETKTLSFGHPVWTVNGVSTGIGLNHFLSRHYTMSFNLSLRQFTLVFCIDRYHSVGLDNVHKYDINRVLQFIYIPEQCPEFTEDIQFLLREGLIEPTRNAGIIYEGYPTERLSILCHAHVYAEFFPKGMTVRQALTSLYPNVHFAELIGEDY